MLVTLQQIADRAGVSRAQVSRVLNRRYKENRPAVAERAERIRRIARELGYRPNLAARSTSAGRFGQIGFVTCGAYGHDWFPPPLLHGLHAGTDAAGQQLLIHELLEHDFQDPDRPPRLFCESTVDCLVLHLEPKLPPQILEAFEEQPVPTVLVNKPRRAASVCPDERHGGLNVARYLIGKGRRRLAFIKLLVRSNPIHFSMADRVAGLNQGMAEAGLSPVTVLGGDPAFQKHRGNGQAIVADFLSATPDLDAVVCYSALEAVLLQLAMAERGWQIGDRLDAVVFNDQPLHSTSGMPMDTAVIPFQQVGEAAAAMAIRMADAADTSGPSAPAAAEAVEYRQIYLQAERRWHQVAPGDGAGDSMGGVDDAASRSHEAGVSGD